MADYRRSIRIPSSLYDKILKEKKNKSINQFIKDQILEDNNFSSSDFLFIKEYIDNNLLKSGNIINHIAREYNSNKPSFIDNRIIKIVEKYISNLNTIKKKKITYEELSDVEPAIEIKNKIISVSFSDNEKNILLDKIKNSDMDASDFFRLKLFNISHYTNKDFFILRRKLHQNVYRTINNIRQIIYNLSFLVDSKNIINSLEKYILKILLLEEEIIFDWSGINGNN